MVHTRAIILTPPRMTTAASRLTTRPTIHCGMPNVSFESSAMEFACTVQPMPNEARAVETAKKRASRFMPSPRSRAYIGPP